PARAGPGLGAGGPPRRARRAACAPRQPTPRGVAMLLLSRAARARVAAPAAPLRAATSGLRRVRPAASPARARAVRRSGCPRGLG
ncbi:unnamed protein product, partial [Prorocentrum cordatum]